MIKVTVTGSECTGKTTLARELSRLYDAPWAGEYAREHVERTGAAPDAGDVEAIACGQLESQRMAVQAAGDLVIFDTDLLSTLVYSRHYYGDCPAWVAAELEADPADLYLLADIDVPWVADGLERDRGGRRPEMQALFRSELTGRGLHFVEVRGTVAERVETARLEIDRLLAKSRRGTP